MEESILSKYGGSSIADRSGLEQIMKITADNHQRKYIVVSAPGARYKGDSKVTQLLVKLAKTKSSQLIDEIISRYEAIYGGKCAEMGVGEALKERVNENLPEEIYMDALKAFGEEFNARLLAKEMNAKFTDPYDFMFVSSS